MIVVVVDVNIYFLFISLKSLQSTIQWKEQGDGGKDNGGEYLFHISLSFTLDFPFKQIAN